ncbi:hypothetical protein, partial [Klebsiella variicola]|uniref:hypothetical protein n=1 Tax=Klebsiella variicola TaxID=244366 RepID=UPI0039C395B8
NLGKNNSELLANYDWKIYKELKDAIVEHARASQGGKATDAMVFARHKAKMVLSTQPPKVIAFGHMIGLCAMVLWSTHGVRD